MAQGHQDSAHLLPEGCNLLLTIVRASLLQIAHGNVVFVAEVLAHLIADADQFVPDFLQTRLVVLIKPGVCLDSGGTHGAVGMLKVFLHAVEIQCLAVEGNFSSRHDLLIFVGQAALLLTQGNVGFAVQLLLQIHRDKVLLAELQLDVRAEGTGGNGITEFYLRTAERGQRILQILDFRFIEFIAGVQGVADVRDTILRGQLTAFAVNLEHQRSQHVIALCVRNRSFPLGEFCAACLQVGTLVLQR